MLIHDFFAWGVLRPVSRRRTTEFYMHHDPCGLASCYYTLSVRGACPLGQGIRSFTSL